MIRFHEGCLQEHQLLDSGDGYRLERFGEFLLARPDPNALWSRRLSQKEWERADAWFHREKRFGTSHWENRSDIPEWWTLRRGPLSFRCRLTSFKHTGIFPEHDANWRWLEQSIAPRAGRCNVLSLFAYTGVASLVAAAAGANVCHVDASKDVVDWARENQVDSGLEDRPIRWIVDDCLAFARRELRRGRRYDGILLDPPAYGRDPQGKVFRFEEHVAPLLKACADLLSDTPLFLMMNAYSLGFSATVMGNMLADVTRGGEIELGELQLRETAMPGKSSRILPCSVFARWIPDGAPFSPTSSITT